MLPIFQQIYFSLTQIKSAMPALNRIENELEYSKKYELNQEIKQISSLHKFDISKKISLKNIYFSYENTQKKAIEDISFDVKKNSFNFIIGPSGSGKTTIVDLILGLLKPSKGEIFIGDEQLTLENSNIWHQNLGYVGQNIFLFDDTIKNNICLQGYDNKEIDNSKLMKAINDSCVENFLTDLPNGLNTVVGQGGTKLSGGQKQRVALARAFYQDKDILILDEATSSLDGYIEKLVLEKLKVYSNTKTVIMITHNVKLCYKADKIFSFGKWKNFRNW